MSWRQQQPVSSSRLAANRRNAQKSTGPRTAAGKSRSSLNALRKGRRSQTIKLLWNIILNAPPGQVVKIARRIMTPAQLALPYVAFMLNEFRSGEDQPLEERMKVRSALSFREGVPHGRSQEVL